LFVDGHLITESLAIVTYVANRFPHAALLPHDDLIMLGRAYEKLSWYATGVHVAISQVFRTERFTDQEDAWPAIREGGRATIEKAYREIDDQLDGPWVLGDRYSVLDTYLHVFWRWAERLGIEMTQLQRWAAQNAWLLERPAVSKVLAAEKAGHEARAAAVG
jgi:glutathione S-transferase